MTREEKRIQNRWNSIARIPDVAWISKLIRTFPQAEVYLVGGAIRDMLIGVATTDYDLVVRNVPAKKLETFLKSQGSVNFVGKTFGVYKFVAKKSKLIEPIDIALPRTEIKNGIEGKYADFLITSDPAITIEDDLARRDFTINAIAYNIAAKRVIDPFNGIADIKALRIQTVGTPAMRFKEDYSRLLRALRFAVSLNAAIAPKTSTALRKLMPKLSSKQHGSFIVPREIIAKELIKTFVADPVRAFDIYDTYSVFTVLIPELLKMKKCPQPKEFHTEGDVWQHTRLALSKIGDTKFKRLFPKEPVTPLLIFATLFHDIGKPATLQTPKQHGVDRIRSNNHDHVGGKMVTDICSRLKLSSYGEADISCESLSWLVQKHLLLVHGPVAQIKNSTLEKYFFNDGVPGIVLRQLFYTDGAATIPKDGNNLRALQSLLKRLAEIKPLVRTNKNKKKRGLIDGNTLKKGLNIPEGPLVGELLLELREAELSGTIHSKAQALLFAKKLLTNRSHATHRRRRTHGKKN